MLIMLSLFSLGEIKWIGFSSGDSIGSSPRETEIRVYSGLLQFISHFSFGKSESSPSTSSRSLSSRGSSFYSSNCMISTGRFYALLC